jgi:hypothetical protein
MIQRGDLMEESSLVSYVVPFLIINGATTYFFSKRSEKNIIEKFDTLRSIKVEPFNGEVIIPDKLKKLVEIIEKNIDKKNLNNLYHNINSLKLEKNMLMLLKGIKGKYDSVKNTLSYSINGSMEHEIIHLASSHYDLECDICQSGFVNYDKKFVFGKALNEGYTDLIARRLFNKKTSFYDGEVRLAQYFELLFNKSDMEKCYFNNDLISFIKMLGECNGKEEAIKLVTTFDRGFDLKKQSNPAYKIIYTNLELKLRELFEKNNKSLLKQIDYVSLASGSAITGKIYKAKKQCGF